MKKIDLTKGKVERVLLSLAIPIMINSLLQFAYNLIDMLWVGSLGSDSVAAVGSSSFFIGLGYSVNALVVIGTGIKVSHAVGEKNKEEVNEYINAGLFLNFIIAIIFAGFLILFSKGLIGFLGVNNLNVERDAIKYLIISAPMMFLAFFNILYIRLLNSFGNNKIALKISALGIVLNILLDPILIYVFKLGVSGAAIATLFSNFVMFMGFNIICRENIRFKKDVKVKLDKVKIIAKLGLPMAFQRILFTLVNIIMAKIIGLFSADAIAAQKIGLQIESITFMIIGGLNGAVASFVGQNYGAKKFDRIKEGYKKALKIGFIYSFVASLICIFNAEILVKLFIREGNALFMAKSYVQIVGIAQVFAMVEMVSNGMFTGIGKPKIPATISIVFTVIRIPMALIFMKFMGLNGIWLSIAISSILKGVMAYGFYLIKIKDEFSLQEIIEK